MAIKEKKYRVIAKINNSKFVKYNCNNLVMFSDFLDKKFSNWHWFNVYLYTKKGDGEQVGKFKNKYKP